jgi:hypothetical protein
MPAERMTMRHVREILRLKLGGDLPTREVARRVGVAPATVRLTLERLAKTGLSWPLADERGTVINDAEFDHFFSNQLPSVEHAWRICKSCHDGLTRRTISRREATMHFFSFQLRLAKLA